jgi:heterodisulfide reductase subunit A-like polyferredoxin
VVGAGPAGLAAANDLALAGHQVTVYEAQPEPGGMLRYGIPEYRLPREKLEKEINYIRKLGVEIKTGVQVGKEVSLASIRQESDAVFIGAGAQSGMSLDVPGGDLPGVTDGIKFLHGVNLGEKVQVGKNVAVIGGGNTAIDCARTAIRLGSREVKIVYRRSRAEMPAAKEEIEALEKEGVTIDYLTLPTRFFADNGTLSRMECRRMVLGEPDASGRRRPVPVEGSEFIVPVDMVITALGQLTQVEFLKELGVSVGKNGTVTIDRMTGATNIDGIFAGGDVVTGAAYVIDAIAAGKRAARSIGRYLKGEPAEIQEYEKEPGRLSDEEVAVLRERYPAQKRVRMNEVPVAERIGSFREVALGFGPAEAVREAMRCVAAQMEGCIECRECERRCDAKAIDFSQQDERVERNVGAIVLAPGYEIFDPRVKKELGYGRYPNVITALQLERILSPSGPFAGKILRPSDLRPPARIAFIQCVGSRDNERDYCSSICCMYATKEAIIAKEHAGDKLSCDIFYIDIRAFSKGFEAYFESAKKLGVNYIRCRIPVIEEQGGTGNLIIKYLDEQDRKSSREYDMVVLSVGMEPPKDARAIAATFGVRLNQFGFCDTSAFSPVDSGIDGIYVAGPFVEPKDIPETVVQASAAASKVLSLLKEARGSLITTREYPPETDVRGQEPRVGVFVCHCGTNIGGVVNVPDVVTYARTLPGVVYVENNLYTCSNDTQERIKEKIAEHRLNRVVVASCTPRTHEPLFKNTIREAGLNPYLFEMANIRDQCSWVHMHEPEKATVKSKDLLRMAVAKVKLDEPLYPHPLEVNHDALVVGGGLAGMTAAIGLADQDFVVHLIEREPELGGYLRRAGYLLNGEDPKQNLSALIQRVSTHKNIRVRTNAVLTEVKGSLGNFVSTVSTGGNGSVLEIQHGIVIVATGADTYKPQEYLYGSDKRVLLHEELEERIAADRFEAQSVVFIQCVGSRNSEHPYCSRTCCSETIKHAIRLKERRPGTDVSVLYREMRSYGFRETYYTKARKLGVKFIRFADDKPPAVVGHNGKLSVVVHAETLNETIQLLADHVVLAPATVPRQSNKDLAQLLKVPLSSDKFFLEAHMKLRPIDFATDGVFLCGNAHSPQGIEETVSQASGTAARAATILSKSQIQLEPTVSHVVEENCDGCAYCIEPCPYKAIVLIEYEVDGQTKKRVEVNESLCKGCGTCMATCPKKAIYVWHFRPEQLTAEVNAALGIGA